MTADAGRGSLLVVDDSELNRKLLRNALERQGHSVETAADGVAALSTLRERGAGAFDVVLLDIVMPRLDGFGTLPEMKADRQLRHLPVIVISTLDDLPSIVRCIEMGATDFLPKPFNASLLRARLHTSLADKRLRDLELEYLEQVGRVVAAAGAVEDGTFEEAALDAVARRGDALGQLARTFQRMAREVAKREARLRRQVDQLRIEIDEARQARTVADITGSEYFQQLRDKAQDLRRALNGPSAGP
ncbi:MAG: response regulator [Nitriliruptorales bacterium]|nr:response regulator [Nitriliruptorales bacterium]